MSDHMDHNEEEMNITLEFDDGEKVVVEPLFIFNLDGKDYIALVPADEESEDVYLYIYNELSDDEFEFLDIEDDDEFEMAVKQLEEIYEA